MRVFMTGATGFIGSIVTQELQAAGHQVTGLARSDEAAAALAGRGVTPLAGDIDQPDLLAEAARAADGVIHCAFGHDFSRYMEAGAADLAAVTAMAEALAGSGKPLVVTSGLTAHPPGRPSTEADPADVEGFSAVRGRPEAATLAAAQSGVRAMVVRLPPSVHDKAQQGLVSQLVAAARASGVSGYIGDGANRWPAVHRRDAARLFRLALESGQPGQRLHAVGEEGVPVRAIAEAIGARLGLPARSLTPEEAGAQLGWVAMPAGNDFPASSAATRAAFNWSPTHPGLLAGLAGEYLD
ncbi:MAG: SDR family oxidoreductase [Proteobacteria bacterium]|nr:SDR family oxidoreductase [Pseudomonadota bacterium]